MTIFGDWLREKTRRIARATAGDKRAAAQLEALRQRVDRTIVQLTEELRRLRIEARWDGDKVTLRPYGASLCGVRTFGGDVCALPVGHQPGVDHGPNATGERPAPRNGGGAGAVRLERAADVPHGLLYEIRMAYRDLTPNLEGLSRDSAERSRERLHDVIMRYGGGEFFS